MVRYLTSLAWAGAVLLAGCAGGDGAPPRREDARATAPAGPVGTASITGVVRLVGTPPPNQPIHMRAEPLCRGFYHSQPRQLRVVVGRSDGLANVFVYVKRGLPPQAHYAAPPEAVTLDQRGCQYHPRIVGVMVGQPLEIRNGDPVPHAIRAVDATRRPFVIADSVSGWKTVTTFSQPDVMVRLSSPVHTWMRAYVGVVPHPFFATTDRAGRYVIGGLPPGTYTIETWHEYYGTRRATVTVADRTTRLDFRYRAETGGAAEF